MSNFDVDIGTGSFGHVTPSQEMACNLYEIAWTSLSRQ